MKICSLCKVEKEKTEFSFRIKDKNILQPHCKQCRKIIDFEFYKNNPQIKREKKERSKITKERNNNYLYQFLLNHPCVDCKESDPVVLDFDHLFDKKGNVSEMAESVSLKTLKAEIAKCVIRCANCHRRKTAREFGYFKYLKQLAGLV